MFVRDDERFWRLDPKRPEVNSWGFLGGEVAVPKPEGLFRVAFLGDSCAQWGEPVPYPAIVQRLLNAAREPGAPEVESLSLAVAGYTSHQGRIVAETYGATVEPDVAVVCYGWNDHWLAYGSPDKDASVHSSAAAAWVARLSRSSHLLRYATAKLSGAGPRTKPPDLRELLGSEVQDDLRVDPQQYRRNLLAMAELFAKEGTPVLFLTPSLGPRGARRAQTLRPSGVRHEPGVAHRAARPIRRHRARGRGGNGPTLARSRARSERARTRSSGRAVPRGRHPLPSRPGASTSRSGSPKP